MNKLLLKHAGTLKNYGAIKKYSHKINYKNHTCGDKATFYLKVSKKIIKKISYKTESCLICQASCSIFSELVKNKDLHKMILLANEFIITAFKKKLALKGKWKKFNFLLKKNFYSRKNCILVPFNALIKLK
jgi:nitrogen fixation NifU-like protein